MSEDKDIWSLMAYKFYKSDVKRRNTLGHLNQYTAQHGCIVKQSTCTFYSIQNQNACVYSGGQTGMKFGVRCIFGLSLEILNVMPNGW